MTHLAGVGATADIIAGDQQPHRGVEAAEAHGDCANCGTALHGAYCHACGQKGHLHTRLLHMAEDFVEGVMHFDGRLWRTLPLLAFRPGRLSRRWIEGKRVRYVAPLHIFLFSVFLFFLALSVSGGRLFTDVFESIAKDRETITVAGSPVSAETCANTDDDFRRWACTALAHVRENPKYYAYKAESLTYKLAPLLAPISMLVLAVLLSFKRGYSLYDHGVVALYGLSFLGLLVTAAMVLSRVVPADLQTFVLAATAGHAAVHLRGAYKLSWFGAAVRMLLLGLLTSIIFLAFLLGVAALSVS